MIVTKPLCQNHHRVVKQTLAVMLTNRPFDAGNLSTNSHRWTAESVSEVLRSVPRFFFQSPRSIGRQTGFRHRSPLRQRSLRKESENSDAGVLVLGPAAHRNPEMVNRGLEKATEFFSWVEDSLGFSHTEATCRAMALVLARGSKPRALWDFLRDMSRREEDRGGRLVTTSTVTCLIKVLAEEGLVNEALTAFHKIRRLRCKPDVRAHNAAINALCLVGDFKKAKFLLEQMELPGFRYPPDAFTYTILISAYCRHGRQTGCRKAVRHRIWAANRLFRGMLSRGLAPDVVTYNSLIDGCLKTHRLGRALELLDEMSKRGGCCTPNRVTYGSFIAYFSRVNEVDRAVEMMRTMVKMSHGTPSSSCYTPIIHALCESGRVSEARDFLAEMLDGGSVPREYTYAMVRDAVSARGDLAPLDEGLRRRIEDGIKERFRRVGKFKPVMGRRGYDQTRNIES